MDLEQLKDEIKDEDKVFELIVTAYDLNFASSIASSDPGAARCRGRVQSSGLLGRVGMQRCPVLRALLASEAPSALRTTARRVAGK